MATSSTERDTRIDFIRGFFILMMCVDHFGFLLALIGTNATSKVYTYNSIGWSSGAEFFVFFSGYVIANVYSKTIASRGLGMTQVRACHRAWELYVRNALVWVLAMGALYFFFRDNTDLLRATQVARAATYPDHGILAFMTLQYVPTYFEVLPLYMVLMMLAPVFLWCHARNSIGPVAVSAAVWLIVQFVPSLNFYRGSPWNFNPFAWQFVFFLGMWFAREKPLTSFDRSHRTRKLAAAIGVLALCTVIKAMDKADVVLPIIGVLDVPGQGKPNVEPLRLAHFLTVIYLVGIAMPSNDWVKRRLATRAVALVGTYSLDCFSLSILLGYLTAGLFSTTSRGNLAYFSLEAVNVFGIMLAAIWFDWLKTPPWRARPAREPMPAPRPELPAPAGAAMPWIGSGARSTGR